MTYNLLPSIIPIQECSYLRPAVNGKNDDDYDDDDYNDNDDDEDNGNSDH